MASTAALVSAKLIGHIDFAVLGQTRRKAGTQSHRSKARSYDSGVASKVQAVYFVD
jgi:hypothetical protein